MRLAGEVDAAGHLAAPQGLPQGEDPVIAVGTAQGKLILDFASGLQGEVADGVPREVPIASLGETVFDSVRTAFYRDSLV